jgi:hypothetical protein
MDVWNLKGINVTTPQPLLYLMLQPSPVILDEMSSVVSDPDPRANSG